MLSHVSRKDHTNDTFAEHFPLICVKHFNKVVLSGQQNLHTLRRVPVFLDSFVMETQRPLSHEVNMVTIVKAIVSKVVTGARCNCSNKI